MARSIHKTLLPLDQWAENLGMNPWVFNQFDNLKIQGKTDQCQSVWFQRSWNGKYLSRDEVAFTIQAAENTIAEYTRIWIAPKYIAEENVVYKGPRNQSSRSMFNLRGRWKQTPLKYLNARVSGTETWEFLDTVPVVMNADMSLFDTPFTAAYTNASDYSLDELVAVFPEAERDNDPADLTWVIRPLKITETAGVVTFKGPRYLIPKPTLQNVSNASALDPLLLTSYVDEIDVYRVYIDETHTTSNPAQGVAVWEVSPEWWGDWCEPNCGVYTAPLCLQAHDADAGIVRAQVNSTDWPLYQWGSTRGPDRLQVNYLAGIPLQNQKVDPFWADVATKLAVSTLPAEDCGCARHNGILKFWRMLPSEGNENSRQLTVNEIDGPFGPRRGARYAWERVQRFNLDEYSY